MALKRDLVPLANLLGVQVIDDGQRVKLVNAGRYISVLDVGEPAQVDDEIGPPTLASKLITGALNVSKRQAKSFPSAAQTRPRLNAGRGKCSRIVQAVNRHGRPAFLLCFRNRKLSRSGNAYFAREGPLILQGGPAAPEGLRHPPQNVRKFSAGIAAGWKFRIATEDAGTEFAWKRAKAVRKIIMCNLGEPRPTAIPPIIASGVKSVLE